MFMVSHKVMEGTNIWPVGSILISYEGQLKSDISGAQSSQENGGKFVYDGKSE